MPGDMVTIGEMFSDLEPVMTVGKGGEGAVTQVYVTNLATGERMNLMKKTFWPSPAIAHLQHLRGAAKQMDLEQAMPAKTMAQTLGASCVFHSSTEAECTLYMKNAGPAVSSVMAGMRAEAKAEQLAAEQAREGYAVRAVITVLSDAAMAAKSAAAAVRGEYQRLQKLGSGRGGAKGTYQYGGLLKGLAALGAAATGVLSKGNSSECILDADLWPVFKGIADVGSTLDELHSADDLESKEGASNRGTDLLSVTVARDLLLPTLRSYSAAHRAGLVVTDGDQSNSTEKVRPQSGTMVEWKCTA